MEDYFGWITIISLVLLFGLINRAGKARRRYNGAVDIRLRNEYQIETNGNNHFPELTEYLNFIKLSKKNSMNADETALHIATLYYCSLLSAQMFEEASAVLLSIEALSLKHTLEGYISEQSYLKSLELISDAETEANIAE